MPHKDLVVLAADLNMEFAVRGLISREYALRIRRITFEVFRHPHRDPGCLLRSHLFLRPYSGQYAHAIVMFDREGCGREDLSSSELTQMVEQGLDSSGWNGRATAIVLDPELENWVWSDSPHLADVFGWRDRQPDLRTWLNRKGHWPEGFSKPRNPKSAVEDALRETGTPRSSALYRNLAERVSFQRCTDPSFERFRTQLATWFPIIDE
jgi:hypothetical protein